MNELNIQLPIACKKLIGYSDAEKKIINIRANKLSGDFDEPILYEWLDEIQEEFENIELTGFEEINNIDKEIKEKEIGILYTKNKCPNCNYEW
jgi:hypothetical protein